MCFESIPGMFGMATTEPVAIIQSSKVTIVSCSESILTLVLLMKLAWPIMTSI